MLLARSNPYLGDSSVTILAIACFSFCNAFVLNCRLHAQQNGFQYALKSVLEPDAEKYVVSKTNIRTFHERFKPHHSYWAAAVNDIPASMTFRFSLEKPLISARLYTNIIVANFNNNKSYGTGTGRGSLWCSRDGKNWLLLIDAVPPEVVAVKGYDYYKNLPSELRGSKEIWLQIRLLATGMKDSTYSSAQFARKDYSDPKSTVFELRVKYAFPVQDKVDHETGGISK